MPSEFVPVLRGIHVEKRNAQSVVKRPAQRQLARFAGNQFGDDRAMTRDLDIEGDIGLAFDVDDFAAVLRLDPSVRGLILRPGVEVFDVDSSPSDQRW